MTQDDGVVNDETPYKIFPLNLFLRLKEHRLMFIKASTRALMKPGLAVTLNIVYQGVVH